LPSSRDAQMKAPKPLVHPLARETDFYGAWVAVEAADSYPAQTRARAFALWVGLFGRIGDDHIVTDNFEEIAELFEVTRPTWQTYRKLLSEAGLIEQRRSTDRGRRTFVKLCPPRIEA